MGDILLVMQNKNRKCVSHMSKSMPRLEGKYKNVHLQNFTNLHEVQITVFTGHVYKQYFV